MDRPVTDSRLPGALIVSRIRPAAPSDANAIYNMLTLNTEPGPSSIGEIVRMMDVGPAYISENSDGDILGVLFVESLAATRRIELLAVRIIARKAGTIARALLAHAGQQQGFPLEAIVEETDLDGQRFYGACGFRHVDTIAGAFEDAGTEFEYDNAGDLAYDTREVRNGLRMVAGRACWWDLWLIDGRGERMLVAEFATVAEFNKQKSFITDRLEVGQSVELVPMGTWPGTARPKPRTFTYERTCYQRYDVVVLPDFSQPIATVWKMSEAKAMAAELTRNGSRAVAILRPDRIKPATSEGGAE